MGLYDYDSYGEDQGGEEFELDEFGNPIRKKYAGEVSPGLYDPPEEARPVSSADAVAQKAKTDLDAQFRATLAGNDIPPVNPMSEAEKRPEIPPIEMPENPNQGFIDEMRQWTLDKPNREDYKPSFGRKLLGGIVGFASGMGGNQTGVESAHGFVHRKYNEAMEDWRERGKALGEVAPVLGKERASDINQWRIGVTQRGQNVAHETAEERLAHEEKDLAETTRYHGATEKQRTEEEKGRGKRSAEDIKVRKEANAARRFATTEAGRRQERALNAGAGVEENVSGSEQDAAEKKALRDLLTFPEYEKFIDAESGAITPPDPDEEDPEVIDSYHRFIADLERRKKARLSTRRPGRTRLAVEPVSSFDEE